MVKTRSSKRIARNRIMALAAIALVIAASAAGYYSYLKQQASGNSQPALATTTIGTGDIVLLATGPGTLALDQDVSFGFKNRGQVSKVLVKLGDKVEAGQVLARLASTTLELQYEQARANLAALSSPAAIATAEQAVEDAKTAFATARNNLQYLIGPEMLFAEENVADAQQRLNIAKTVAQKDPSSANQQSVADAETALASANTTFNWVEYNFSSNYTLQTFTYPVRNDKGVTLRKELFAPTNVDISVARAAYDLATANLADAQNYLEALNGSQRTDQVPSSSVVTIAEAQTALNQTKANLDAATLTAPISGTITSLSLNAGDNVGTSAVVTISNTIQPYTLDVSLDETDWDKAKIGNDASVTFDLLPNKTYPGKVIQVYPVLDDSSGTSLVHIVVQLNTTLDVELPAGANASVDVTGGKALGVTLVPVTALEEVETGKYIAYLMKNGQPVEQTVEVGLQDIVNAEVKSGLKPGDIVLANAPGGN